MSEGWAIGLVTLGATVAIPFVVTLWRRRLRPRIRVYFDEAETYHRRFGPGGKHAYFCHVMVANNGREVARQCQGRLMAVRTSSQNGTRAPVANFVAPVVLKWAHQPDWGVRDVDPLTSRRLDLCYATETNPTRLQFFVEPIPLGVQTVFPPGEYLANVRVDSANARAAEGWFRIDFTRGWDQIVVASSQGGP
jgi:hypothetical protein